MRLIITAVFLTVFQLGFSQLKKAESYYTSYQYALAAESFEKAYEKKPTEEVAFKLSECYRLTNQYQKAVQYYKELSNLAPERSYYYLNYALTLKSTGDYQTAQVVFRKYLDKYPDGEDVQDILDQIRSCEIVDELMQNKSLANIEPLMINSEYNDFSPFIFKDNLIFCSSRRNDMILDKTYGYDEEAFIDLYSSKVVAKNEFEDPVRLGQPINSNLHESPGLFSPKYKCMFFTRNNMEYDKKKDEYVNRLKIYYSNYKDGEFQESKPFQYNVDGYSVGHPAIPPSGKFFYFISDMPGGVGETDIYICILTKKGWSAPVNLGRPLNTTGKEMFLYAPDDATLYFSSDRHVGLGGLDIYKATIKRGKITNIDNLGFPINSSYDDFGLYLRNLNGTNGYFTSNRDSLSDNIYSFRKTQLELTLLVVDSLTYKPIPFADVKLKPGLSVYKNFSTDKNGKSKLNLAPGDIFRLDIEKEGYLPEHLEIDNTNLVEAKDTTIIVAMIQGNPDALNGIVVDQSTGDPLDEAKVELNSQILNAPEKVTTAGQGKFEFLDIKPVPYEIKVSRRGYLSKTVDVPNGQEQKEDLIIPLEKIRMDTALALENIYYDYDKSNILPKSEEVLDELIEIMKDNPTLVIQLHSHTDQRGTDKYNQKLSLRRAESAFDYLIERGIDRVRLSYKYFGKTQLAFPCPEGQDCDDAWHVRNRRTEFYIISY